jgi:molybdopterin converting factor small subunit
MKVRVRIPSVLLKLTSGESEVEVTGENVGEVLLSLSKKYPGIKERVYAEDGRLRAFINIYVNDEDIRFLDAENTKTPDGSVVSIVPAIAGG